MPARKVVSDIDPQVNVPPAVKAAAARAAEIHAAAYPTEIDPTLQPVVEPIVPEPAAVVAPVIEPVITSVVTPQGNDTWEHKYNSMKGRHDRLETTNKHLTERVSGMEQTLAIMAANEPLPTAAPGQPASLLTPEETAEWGPELLDVVGRRAKEQFAPVIAGLEDQIKSLNERLQSVGGVMAQDARGRMLEDLTKVLPNWKEVNSNQNFLNWLVLPDTYSGAIRDQLLQAAYTANDTPRVLAFFNGFLAEEAALSPRTPAPDPTVVPDTARVPLESFAAPGRAKTAAAIDAPAEKPSFTRAQVATFYTDVARGSYRGRDDEKIAIERQISEAGREGRIK